MGIGRSANSQTMEGLESDEALLLRKCKDLACFFRSVRDRFLDEDVLARFQSAHRPLEVQAVGQLRARWSAASRAATRPAPRTGLYTASMSGSAMSSARGQHSNTTRGRDARL